MSVRVGIDTGGTFTDLVYQDLETKEVGVRKILSTPKDPSIAIKDLIDQVGLDPKEIAILVFGTTAATNALIEKKGAKVGLITTKGFSDVLKIQRITRPHHFSLKWVKSEHLVPRNLCIGVTERVNVKGQIITPLNEDEVRKAVERFKEEKLDAIAISLLFSFKNPTHERRIQQIIREYYAEACVSLSSEVLPQWREYERTSSTVIDAFLRPLMNDFVSKLESKIKSWGIPHLLIMRSNGGSMTPQAAKERPITLVKSGPAGGVIGSRYFTRLTSRSNLIVADMGGTSFDACLIVNNEPLYTYSTELEWGVPVATPMIDDRSIGAGGGSIAWVDSAGVLKVGPESAGSDPGPVCYGRGGGAPTVTDANLILGRLRRELKLAGYLSLDYELAKRAITALSEKVGLSLEECAVGIIKITNSNMAQALRLISIDKGYDIRDFSIIAFGGAGPLHAAEIAGNMKIKEEIVPVFPGNFSALGALVADIRFDYVQTNIMYSKDIDIERINSVWRDLELKARQDLSREGVDESARQLIRSIEMRYFGQNWELDVEVPNAEFTPEIVEKTRRKFDALHKKRFGYNIEGEMFEFVNFRLVAIGKKYEFKLRELPPGEMKGPHTFGRVYFEKTGQFEKCPFYLRQSLHPGNSFEGPAIIEEKNSTTLVPPESRVDIDKFGNIMITLEE